MQDCITIIKGIDTDEQQADVLTKNLDGEKGLTVRKIMCGWKES